MEKHIKLSYSTINAMKEMPHTWVCKQMGLKTKNLPVFAEGNAVHSLIQRHVSGTELSPLLANKKLPTFPIVETRKMDSATSRTLAIDGKYSLYGFADGLNFDTKQLLEIKSAGTPWSAGRLHKTMQWRVYGLLFPEMEEVVLITSKRDLADPDWSKSVAVIKQPITEQDRQNAWEWVKSAVDFIEAGDFQLEPNTGYNKCLYIGCPWCGGN